MGSVLAVAARAAAEPRTYPGATAVLAEPQTSPYRVHVARMGEVALVPGGPESADGGHVLDPMLEVPVVGERGALVRVLIAHDHARTLVWVHADELAWSVVRPVRLAGKGDAGIWLNTGAPVAVRGGGRRRTIGFDDATVRVTGTVAAGEIDRVFPVSAPVEPTFGPTAPELRVAPGGAFLYADLGGDLVGVQLATERRYVAGQRGDWWRVYVGTPWGLVQAWGQSLGADATGAPLWQRCTAVP